MYFFLVKHEVVIYVKVVLDAGIRCAIVFTYASCEVTGNAMLVFVVHLLLLFVLQKC
jgi:hypothetical protein